MKRHIFITTCVGIIMFLLGILLERGGITKTQAVSEKEIIVAESQSPQIRIFNQNIEWYDGSNWNLLSPVAELEGKDPFVEAGGATAGGSTGGTTTPTEPVTPPTPPPTTPTKPSGGSDGENGEWSPDMM